MVKHDVVKLLVSVVGVLLVGFAGSYVTVVDGWYETLVKPAFNPPSWVFGPVWTVLYVIIGLSLYFVWMQKPKLNVYFVFAVQLVLNFLWSLLFFGRHTIFGAFVDIILLWLAILLNIIVFYRVSKLAGLLLAPYLLWVSFAAVLNYAFLTLN